MEANSIFTDSADLEALRRLPPVGAKPDSLLENLTTREVRLDIEKNFNDEAWHAWMETNWWVSIIAAALYVVTIFTVQNMMKSRKRFELRGLLIMWNIFLAVFSIFGAYRSCLAMYRDLTAHGLHFSVCDNVAYTRHTITGLWAVLFVLSKVVEFGDTLFIVLRKGKLIFLHWYHHVTVLIYVCYSYSDQAATGYWFMVLNFIVHSLMYSYYAVRAAGYRTPKFIPVTITSLQIAQMVGGCLIQVYVFTVLRQDGKCSVTKWNNFMGSLMYFSYLFLFLQFFLNSYMKKPTRDLKKD